MNLIGKHVEVINSSNPNMMGIKGLVVEETKNTFIISVDGRRKIIPKKGTVFRIYLYSGYKDVRGENLIGRLERRLVK
jgi:ribonuclease P protein subunit POP4